MEKERIKEIQRETAYPNSVSVQQALLKVWNECSQELQSLQEENERLRETSIGNFTYAELWRMAQKYNADDFVQALQQALQSEE